MDTRYVTRLERALHVVEGTVEAATRLEGRALWTEACRLLVEGAGFRLAWVGRVDARSGGVFPVASAGDSDGYLSALTATTDTKPHGMGPTGRCVREARSIVCEDIATDPRMEPWRAAALARGYASSAAIPITCEGTVVMVLCAYAGDSKAFTPATMRWLEAVASVLALSCPPGLARSFPPATR